MKEATGNFRPIESLDEVKSLPSSVSASVTYLSTYAQQFRASLGHDTTYYECLDQIETVDALVLAEELTGDLARKDSPAARKAALSHATRTDENVGGDRKALSIYLNSISSLCEKSKDQAELHLKEAQTLEAAGKKSEALKEYREISKIYPNPVTVKKIKELEASPQ